MASRKEYEMLFQLNAQMGGSYSGTFKQAQTAIVSMQKEIQALSKTQSDISAFQKQQNAVEATRNKLQVLQQQYDNIQKEIKETGEYSSTLENKLLSKQQQIDRTSASLAQQTQKLGQMDTALKEAGVDTGNLERESARLGTQMADLKQKQEQAAEGAQDFGDTSVQAFDAIAQAIVTAGIVGALKEIYDAYMECVSAAGDFEAAMSNVEALSGASASEMDQLASMAKELGATTKFTALESADAMGYMAMAGWDVNDMLSGMDGVLQLAAASGEDLAMVSDIVTDSLSAFGLSAADTAHFSDVLAAAATSANTNVSIMGETFKMSASVAGALGYSIEDVAVAVGLMANSGVKGSIAGTALKNTFNGLLEGVTLTSNAFGEYEYSAVRADGTMKDFGSTIDELRGYFNQMTEAERVNNAMAIAGQRGYNGLLAILNATDEDYASLTATINDCTGAAANMAAIKLDNMNGELVLAQSAWDALKNSVGEAFIPVMRELYSVGADVFGELDSFVQQNPALVRAVAAFVGIIGAATAAMAAYAAITKIVAALNLAALFPAAGPILLVVGAVAALAAGIVALASESNEAVPSVKELTTAAQEMNDTMEAATVSYDDTVTSTLAAANVADTYIGKLEEMQAAGVNTTEEQRQYHNTLALLCQTVPELAEYIDLETDTINGGTDALRANTEAWKQNAIQQAYQDQLTELYKSYAAVVVEAEENSIGLTKAQYNLDAANQKYEDTLGRMNKLYAEAQAESDAWNKKTGELTTATNFLTHEYYDLEGSLADVSDEIWTAQQSIENHKKAIEEDNNALSESQEQMELAEEAVKNLSEATGYGGDVSEETAAQTKELNDIIQSTAEEMSQLAEVYTTTYNAAYDSITGQYKLWEKADTTVATSAGNINSALDSQISHWEKYNSNLQTLTERGDEIEGLSEMVASFADGSADSVNAIAGMAGATDEQLSNMVSKWQTLQKEQETASGSIAELKTNFTTAMDELQQELAADIEAMNLGDEAKASGEATIQGFIDAAGSMIDPVKTAYARVASAARSALSPGGSPQADLPGYAVGTQSAAPGFAVVGEHGPELVYFNGGEQVLTAAETAALQDQSLYAEEAQMVTIAPQLLAAMSAMSVNSASPAESMGGSYGGDIILTVSPAYNISGAAGAEELRSVLREHDEGLRDLILEVVAEASADAARRSYT